MSGLVELGIESHIGKNELGWSGLVLTHICLDMYAASLQ